MPITYSSPWITLTGSKDSGTATSGGNDTLTDTGASFGTYADRKVVITSGTGEGQERLIISNTSTILTVAYNWDTNPDNTSTYIISYNTEDIYDADVLGGWGVVTKDDRNYVLDCSMKFGSGTAEWVFKDINTNIVITGVVEHDRGDANYQGFQIGELDENESAYNGCYFGVLGTYTSPNKIYPNNNNNGDSGLCFYYDSRIEFAFNTFCRFYGRNSEWVKFYNCNIVSAQGIRVGGSGSVAKGLTLHDAEFPFSATGIYGDPAYDNITIYKSENGIYYYPPGMLDITIKNLICRDTDYTLKLSQWPSSYYYYHTGTYIDCKDNDRDDWTIELSAGLYHNSRVLRGSTYGTKVRDSSDNSEITDAFISIADKYLHFEYIRKSDNLDGMEPIYADIHDENDNGSGDATKYNNIHSPHNVRARKYGFFPTEVPKDFINKLTDSIGLVTDDSVIQSISAAKAHTGIEIKKSVSGWNLTLPTDAVDGDLSLWSNTVATRLYSSNIRTVRNPLQYLFSHLATGTSTYTIDISDDAADIDTGDVSYAFSFIGCMDNVSDGSINLNFLNDLDVEIGNDDTAVTSNKVTQELSTSGIIPVNTRKIEVELVAGASGSDLQFQQLKLVLTNANYDDYGIVIDCDGNDLDDVWHYLQAYIAEDTDLAGLNGLKWHDLLIRDGDKYKTKRGLYKLDIDSTIYRGVKVINYSAAEHMSSYTQDDGTVILLIIDPTAGTINFDTILQNDASAIFKMFFLNDDAGDNTGRDFGTDNAIIVKDKLGSDIILTISGATELAFDYDYDGNIQRGVASAGTDAPVVLVACGLDGAQYVQLTGTITRKSSNDFTFLTDIELQYNIVLDDPTFTGGTQEITNDPGTTEINVKRDLYSAWKRWAITGNNLKYLQAFRPVGAEDIGGDQNSPAFSFLMNNWKFHIDGDNVVVIQNLYCGSEDSDNNINTFPYVVINNGAVSASNSNIPMIRTGSGMSEEEHNWLEGVKNDSHTAEEGSDVLWDEILTGATHNIPGSSGRRLRTLASAIIRNEVAQGSGIGNNQIQLDIDAGSTDGDYDPSLVSIVGGTGIGQSRLILQYNGTTKIATVDRDWKVTPDDTSEFNIIADAGREHVNEGLAQGGTINTIILNTLAASIDSSYSRQLIFIRSGQGQDQVRTIVDYDGTTKVATVDEDWDVIPDTTSAYVMRPVRSETIESLYGGKIFINPDTGSDGSIFPCGTRKHPVKTMAPVLLLASRYGLSFIHVIGSLTISGGEDISGFTFTSDRSIGNSVTVVNAITNETYFDNLFVSGTMNGVVRYTFCVLGAITGFNGGAKECLQTDTISLTGSGNNYMTNVDTYISTEGTYRKIIIGNSKLNMIRCEGNYEIEGKIGTDHTRINILGGHIKVNSDCVAGDIHLEGIGIRKDNSSSGCIVHSDHLVSPEEITDQMFDESKIGHTGALKVMADNLNQSLSLTESNIRSGSFWTERQPAGDTDKNWKVDTNSDGTKHIVANYNGRLYTYDGSFWTEQSPAGYGDKPWVSCVINGDGTRFIAAEYGGRLWTYNGTSWSEQRPAGDVNKNWIDCDISKDGLNFIAIVEGGRVYVFVSGNWMEQQPKGDNDFQWVSCAIGGESIKGIVAEQEGRLYYFNGSSWVEQQPAGDNDKFWIGCNINGDGTKLIACVENGRLYTYDGSAWSEQQPEGDVNKNWIDCDISKDGDKFIACVSNGCIYSYNGTSWIEQRPVGNQGKAWFTCGIGGNGVSFIASVSAGRLYTYAGSDTLTSLSDQLDVVQTDLDDVEDIILYSDNKKTLEKKTESEYEEITYDSEDNPRRTMTLTKVGDMETRERV